MAKYKPGSFSKNFAWHGTGLRKLYDAIQAGFSNKLKPVERNQFRQRCGIADESLQLIPINFFLYNKIEGAQNKLVVDELVFRSLVHSHSLAFDRLALFAIHLSKAGKRIRNSGIESPTKWINEFVRKDLWSDGYWNKQKLDKSNMDIFIETVLDATKDVRTKCRTNYRHLFELCQYIPCPNTLIDSGAEDWIGGAHFLAWDRYLMDGGLLTTNDKSLLLKFANQEELYKLIGIPNDQAKDYQDLLVDSYIEVECLNRFKSEEIELSDSVKIEPPPIKSKKLHLVPNKAILLERIEDERRDEVLRRRREYDAQVRNAQFAAKLKILYDFECQFCGNKLQVGLSPDRFYAEGAHIKGLGSPDNGPDVISNMLVLCPNHHKQFDNGILLLKRVSSTELQIISRAEGHELNNKTIMLKQNHIIEDEFLIWHEKKWRSRDR